MATVSSQYNLAINVGGKSDTKHIDKSSQKLQSFGKGVDRVIGGLKNAAVAAVAVGATFKQAFELSKQGAQLNQLTESFERMNEEVFQIPGLLDKMSEAARGTIKETDLMAGLLTLTAGASDDMAKRFAEAAPKLLEIAKASNKLNPALGDTAFLYDSISKGIKRQSPLILDNLGIVFKIGEANEKYAQQIGKTVEQLTAEEKQIALLNATMEAGDQLINQVGGSVDSQADAWAQLEVKIGEATDGFKRFLAEGLNPVISAAGGGYNNTAENIIQKNLEMADSLGDFIRQGQKLSETRAMFGGLATTITGSNQAIEDGAMGVVTAIARKSDTIDEFLTSLNTAFAARPDLRMKALADSGFETEAAFYAANQAIVAGEKALDGWFASETTVVDTTNALTEAAEYNDLQYRALVASTGNFDDRLEGLYVTQSDLDAIEQQRNDTLAEQEAALKAAAEATAALEAKTGSYFTAIVNGNGDLDFFNESIADLEREFVSVGGRTAEQSEALGKLQDQYNNAAETIRDYEFGVKGANLTDEERNIKIAEQQEIMGELSAKIEPLTNITGELVAVNNELTINQDELNIALFDAASASGASAEELAILGGALGLYSDEAIEAALKTAAIQVKIDELGAAYAAGTISVSGMQTELQSFIDGLNNMPTEKVVNVRTNYTSTGTPPPVGGTPTSPGGGPVARAHGGPVLPGETYRVGERNLPELLSTGNGLFLIPGDRGRVFSNSQSTMAAGNEYIFNIDARGASPGVEQLIERGVKQALLQSGIRADIRRRS